MIGQWMLATVAFGILIAAASHGAMGLLMRIHIPLRWGATFLMFVSVFLPVVVGLRALPTTGTFLAGGGTDVGDAGRLLAAHQATLDRILMIGWSLVAATGAILVLRAHRRATKHVANFPRRLLLGETVAMAPDFGPAAVGLLRSEIVVPEWVFNLSQADQEFILRHEREHIRTGDQFVLFAGVLMVVAMPWNLGLWWQLRRLRLAIELDCDRRVAPSANERPLYGRLLLEARALHRAHDLGLPLVPSPSVFAERLFALLDPAQPPISRMITRGALMVVGGICAFQVPIPRGVAAGLFMVSPAVGDVPGQAPSVSGIGAGTQAVIAIGPAPHAITIPTSVVAPARSNAGRTPSDSDDVYTAVPDDEARAQSWRYTQAEPGFGGSSRVTDTTAWRRFGPTGLDTTGRTNANVAGGGTGFRSSTAVFFSESRPLIRDSLQLINRAGPGAPTIDASPADSTGALLN